MGIYGCDSISFEDVKMTTDNHVSTFRVYFDIDDVDTLALLAIIAKHSQLENELCYVKHC